MLRLIRDDASDESDISDPEDDSDVVEETLALERPDLPIPGSTARKRNRPISSSASAPSSSAPSSSAPSSSSAPLRMTVTNTSEMSRVKCLLLPESIVVKGSGTHTYPQVYYANNGSKVLRHLQVWHPNFLVQFEQAARQSRGQEFLQTHLKSLPLLKESVQPRLDLWFVSHRKISMKVSQALMILFAGHSFRSLDNPFQELFFQAANIDSSARLKRKEFKDHYFPQIIGCVENQIKAILMQQKNISITTDAWTDKQSRGYLAVTAHWIDSEWIARHCLFDLFPLDERHTSEYLKISISNIINSFAGMCPIHLLVLFFLIYFFVSFPSLTFMYFFICFSSLNFRNR